MSEQRPDFPSTAVEFREFTFIQDSVGLRALQELGYSPIEMRKQGWRLNKFDAATLLQLTKSSGDVSTLIQAGPFGLEIWRTRWGKKDPKAFSGRRMEERVVIADHWKLKSWRISLEAGETPSEERPDLEIVIDRNGKIDWRSCMIREAGSEVYAEGRPPTEIQKALKGWKFPEEAFSQSVDRKTTFSSLIKAAELDPQEPLNLGAVIKVAKTPSG